MDSSARKYMAASLLEGLPLKHITKAKKEGTSLNGSFQCDCLGGPAGPLSLLGPREDQPGRSDPSQ